MGVVKQCLNLKQLVCSRVFSLLNLQCGVCPFLACFPKKSVSRIQSLAIQMRATILYLANLWMDFKMLFTTNIFLYLVKVLLLTCPLISQFIAHFWSICPFLCTASFTIPIIIQVRAAAKHTLPLLPLLPSFSPSPPWVFSISVKKGLA